MHPRDFPSLTAELSPAERAEAGITAVMERPYPGSYDKRPDFEGEEVDEGWIGESAEGIWICRHPLSAMAETPELWRVFSRWRHGDREITRRDLEELSAVEMEAKEAMVAADVRSLKARSKSE